MKLLQLIYTSCKRGLSAGAGFQTYSMSEGITDDEKREIERYGLYVPPTDLPTQPTPEQIEMMFPTAYRFFRLSSGRYGICQSKYIGRDYSGRYGNYFCHALISDNGPFPVYPIQLYGSPRFRDCLTDEEDERSTTPPPLPLLDPALFFSEPSITAENITELVEQDGIRWIKETIAAAIEFAETHRGLIFTGPADQIPLRIAALQMAFPIELAHRLTFATYSHDPSAMNTTITGIPATGTRFQFSETQRNYENYIFDFESTAPVLDKQYDYAENVDLGYTVSVESLKEFHRFIEGFDIREIDGELDKVSHLFRMTRVGVANIPADRLSSAVRFAEQKATPAILKQLGDDFHRIIDDLATGVDFKSAEITAVFLFKIAGQSRSKHHIETAYRFFFQALDHQAVNNPDVEIESVRHYLTAVLEENKNNKEEFAQHVLSPDRFARINGILTETPDAAAAEIYFHHQVSTAVANGKTWDQLQDSTAEFHRFILLAVTAQAAENLARSMATAANDEDYFVRLISFCLTDPSFDHQKQSRILRGYIEAITRKPSAAAAHIRSKLIRLGHMQFIYDEYKELLHRAANKPEFFQGIIDSLFMKEKAFMEKYLNDAVNHYLDTLEKKHISRECENIIPYIEKLTHPPVLERVIKGFEQGIPLSSPDKKRAKIISTVQEIKRTQKIITTPDITHLMMLGMESEKARLNHGGLKVSDLIKPGSETYALRDLNLRQVTEYFNWNFRYLIRLVKNSRDHETIFRWFGASVLDKQFTQTYIDELQVVIKENKKNGNCILLYFLEYYLSKLLTDSQYDFVRHKIHRQLVKILAKLPQNQFKDVCSAAERSKEIQGADTKAGFKRIMMDVSEKKNNSVLGRVKRLFGKKEKNHSNNKKNKNHNKKQKKSEV
jgi:hypothetical protein